MRNAKQIVLIILFVAGITAVALFVFREERGVVITTSDTTYAISISIPRTENNALADSVQTYAEFLEAEFVEMYGPDSFSPQEYEALGFADGRQYELIVGGRFWQYGSISGMVLERYTYTGGAHGATDFLHFAFDADGTPITLEALFVAQSRYLERIAEYVRPPLRKKLEDKNVFLENMFDVGTKADPGNYMVFTLDKEGITFVFQEYQVAPYVAGVQTITVPFSNLADILNPSYF